MGWLQDICRVQFLPAVILALPAVVRVFFRSRVDTALEILALRQQLAVLHRKRPRPRLNHVDRFFWTTLRRVWPRWAEVLIIVKPDTLVGWHRAGFRLFWKWRSRGHGGRPKTTAEIRALIRRLAEENPTWGAPKVHGELQKLGLVISERSVARYLRMVRRRGDPKKSWLTFLQNHREAIVAVDFLTVPSVILPTALLLLCDRARTTEDLTLQRDSPVSGRPPGGGSSFGLHSSVHFASASARS